MQSRSSVNAAIVKESRNANKERNPIKRWDRQKKDNRKRALRTLIRIRNASTAMSDEHICTLCFRQRQRYRERQGGKINF